jgi:hypothetical protein
MASEPKQNTSICLALRNRAFVGLWLPSVVSGVCVSAQDTAATWLAKALAEFLFKQDSLADMILTGDARDGS